MKVWLWFPAAACNLLLVFAAPPPTAARAAIRIDYPSRGSLFPPDFAPPRIIWHDPAPAASSWRVSIQFAGGAPPLKTAVSVEPLPLGPIDPRAVADTNKPPVLTPYQKSAKTWVPDQQTWDALRRNAVAQPAILTIEGLNPGGTPVSSGNLTLRISTDPVGAPIFYRDVPLIPFEGARGVINPLPLYAVPLIEWRLRDVGQTSSRLMLSNMPTCANCHSFAGDGKTLGMDLDGPLSDKGLYAVVPIEQETIIRELDVIKWTPRGEHAKKRFGFMSQLSPSGRYVITSMESEDDKGRQLVERLFNAGYKDFAFGQVFYPTRGVLGWYSKETGGLRPLPGADDPNFVQTSAMWSPDGKYLIFSRAPARDPYPANQKPATCANDPNETPIQYDLYRIPFNEGRGGKAEPLAGASKNGKSNSFPKVSPDGRWIVYVQARNGLLMRPDSELHIVPAQGGAARRLKCNASPMNSWHSWSPNGRWLVFSSKRDSPYTRMYLTHIDSNGDDSPAILIENSTAANRAVNIPEFVNLPPDQFSKLEVPAAQFYGLTDDAFSLTSKGRFDEAMENWRKALAIHPADDTANFSLGMLLLQTGKIADSLPHFRQAIETNPGFANAHSGYAVALALSGRMDEAVPHFEKELELHPDSAETHNNYARALAEYGRPAEAVTHFRRAAELAPRDANVHHNFGRALAAQGEGAQAIDELIKAVALDPNLAAAQHSLGDALFQAGGRTPEAIVHWREVLRVEPDNVLVLFKTAWALATCPVAEARNGQLALEMAKRANNLARISQPLILDALAAAYAELGRFDEAIQTAQEAHQLAVQKGNREFATALETRITAYQAHKPVRQ